MYVCAFICIFTRFSLFILERREVREKVRERNINVWLPLVCPLLRTWPAAQECALTGNWTSDTLVRRTMCNPLSYTSQGCIYIYLYLPFVLCVLYGWLKLLVLCNFHSGAQAEGAAPFWDIVRLMPERKKEESPICSGCKSFPLKKAHITSTHISFGKPSGTAKVKVKRVGSIIFTQEG